MTFRLFAPLLMFALFWSNQPTAQALPSSTQADWMLRIAPDVPPESLGQDMTYDSLSNVMVMVGSPNSTDTWELSGNTWMSKNPTHSPGNKYRYGLTSS